MRLLNIKEQVFNLIRKNVSVIYEDSIITEKTNIMDDLGFDSITIIQLVLDVEETFGIEFDDATEYDDVVTVGNLIEFVSKKIGVMKSV